MSPRRIYPDWVTNVKSTGTSKGLSYLGLWSVTDKRSREAERSEIYSVPYVDT